MDHLAQYRKFTWGLGILKSTAFWLPAGVTKLTFALQAKLNGVVSLEYFCGGILKDGKGYGLLPASATDWDNVYAPTIVAIDATGLGLVRFVWTITAPLPCGWYRLAHAAGPGAAWVNNVITEMDPNNAFVGTM